MNLWRRAVIALLLLSALGGLFVHEEATSDARTPTNWRPPTPGLYVSSDPRVLVVAVVFTVVVVAVDRRLAWEWATKSAPRR